MITMELTGKAKEDFEKWFITQFLNIENDQWAILELNKFYRHQESMKWGVYVDFFDSVGVEINDAIGFYDILTKDDVFLQEECDVKTRKSARTAALEKANEIYNNYDTNGKS